LRASSPVLYFLLRSCNSSILENYLELKRWRETRI
jgi:hypothetical protein